jgi:hypothetical protein
MNGVPVLKTTSMGRKNWLFNWAEPGAKHIGIMQSLIVTCRLHDIDPYDYLVDVLQRAAQQTTSKVHELTRRLLLVYVRILTATDALLATALCEAAGTM